MSSLSAKDRMSLCSFTFSDGRRCRTPRTGKNPYFCFYHAQKEARARTAKKLGKDLGYFFSGDYLSACDLSTALGRLIPAVLRGDVKPRTARTVAYLAQTLLQTIHLSEQEYINAFGTNGWRQSIRDSVNDNHDYLFPPGPAPAPEPQPPAPSPLRTNLRSESAQPQPAPHPTAPTVGPSNVVAGLQTGSLPATPHVQPAPPNPQPVETFQASTAQPNNPPPTRPSTPPKATSSSPSASLTPTGATPPAPPQPQAQTPASQPACPEQSRRVNPREPNRDAPWLHWGDQSHIRPDSKLL